MASACFHWRNDEARYCSKERRSSLLGALTAAARSAGVAGADGAGADPAASPVSTSRTTSHFVGKQRSDVRKATAIVNGDGHHRHRRRPAARAGRARQPDPACRPRRCERFCAQVLRNLIDEIAARSRRPSSRTSRSSDQEIERLLRTRRQQFPSQTPQAFSAYLCARSAPPSASLKRQIRGELAWQRLQRAEIEPFVNVGDEEVQGGDRPDDAVARHRRNIMSPKSSCRRPPRPRPQVAGQCRPTSSSRSAAARPSRPMRANSPKPRPRRSAAISAGCAPSSCPRSSPSAVQQMPVGAISEPIPIPGGFSIIAAGRQAPVVLTADPRDAVLSLMQMSVALPAGYDPRAGGGARPAARPGRPRAWAAAARAPAAAQTIGAEVVANDQVRVRDLPPALQQMLLNLSVGQATRRSARPERLSVLVLCGRDDPPAASRAELRTRSTNQMERGAGRQRARSVTCATCGAMR